MSRRILLVALLVIFFIALVARADARMTNDLQRLAVFTPVAAATFTPQCGTANVTIQEPSAANVDGEAYVDGSCRITIRPGLDDLRFCEVLIHEYGHLAGYEHAPEHSGNIMQPDADVELPQCDEAIQNNLVDYDRATDFAGPDLALIKGVRHNTPAYARGVRWIVYERSGERWLISGTGRNMTAEDTGRFYLPKGTASTRNAVS